MGLDLTASDDDFPEADESAQISRFIRTFFPNNSGALASSAHEEIEYKYFPSETGAVIERLRQDAEMIQDRTLMRAFKFGPNSNPLLPQGIDMVRIRYEGDGVKVAIKKTTNHHAVEQEFDTPETLDDLLERFTNSGILPYQELEKYRTTWKFGACTIILDECPGLEPFFEIEGPTEGAVEETWNALGGVAIWGEKKKMSGTDLYTDRYGAEFRQTHTEITFRNPFFTEPSQ